MNVDLENVVVIDAEMAMDVVAPAAAAMDVVTPAAVAMDVVAPAVSVHLTVVLNAIVMDLSAIDCAVHHPKN